MSTNFHLDVLPAKQIKVLQLLTFQNWLNPFYLVGGTALALQIGHRQSVDFDFFTMSNFKNRNIISALTKLGRFELFDEAENTVNGILNNVKVSFLKYEYPLLKSKHSYQTISIADIFDIALMKISTISGRGAKKDFIDFYFILRQFSLSELFSAYKLKYGVQVSNYYHLQKSLVYFDDAENEPMPRMVESVEWDEIRRSIIEKVRELGF
jgi:hypothetical protein